MKLIYDLKIILSTLLILITILPNLLFAQNGNSLNADFEIGKSFYPSNFRLNHSPNSEIQNSLAFKQDFNQKWGTVNLPSEIMNDDFKPWESEKHFWVGVTEIGQMALILRDCERQFA